MTLYLGLYLIIEELLLEFGEGIITTIIIKVQRIQHISKGKKDSSQKCYNLTDTISQCSYTLPLELVLMFLKEASYAH